MMPWCPGWVLAGLDPTSSRLRAARVAVSEYAARASHPHPAAICLR